MKKSWAMKWAKALESGRYKQGRYSLKNKQAEYCCLGVLCAITRAHRVQEGKYTYFGRTLEHSDTHLPKSVQVKVGMASEHGKLPAAAIEVAALGADVEGLKMDSLMIGNDRGKTFKEIAAVIRKYWRDL